MAGILERHLRESLEILAGYRGDKEKKRAARIEELTDLANNVSIVKLGASAEIEVERQARVDEDGALAAEITTLTASYDGLNATVTTHSTTLATHGTTLASHGTTLTAHGNTLNSQDAQVTAQGTAIADLEGNLAASLTFRVRAGSAGALLDLVAADDASNSTAPVSVARIEATNIILKGSVSAEMMVFGLGRNILNNANFKAGTQGWTLLEDSTLAGKHTLSVRPAGATWAGASYPTLMLYQNDATAGGSGQTLGRPIKDATGAVAVGYPVTPGNWYAVSAKLSCHRCAASVSIAWYDDTGAWISTSTYSAASDTGSGSSTNPGSWPVHWKNAQAPAGAAYCRPIFRKSGTTSGTNSYLFINEPQIAESHANAINPPPFSPDGTTLIAGGQIITGSVTASMAIFAAAAIGTADIANAAITSAKIADLAVDTLKIAGNAVNLPQFQFTSGVISFGTTGTAYEVASVTNSTDANAAAGNKSATFSCQLNCSTTGSGLMKAEAVITIIREQGPSNTRTSYSFTYRDFFNHDTSSFNNMTPITVTAQFGPATSGLPEKFIVEISKGSASSGAAVIGVTNRMLNVMNVKR